MGLTRCYKKAVLFTFIMAIWLGYRWFLGPIDREFEFYEFFSFLKFNEFYEFFSLEKNS